MEVVVIFVWCIGVVADAPGWAGGGWWRLSLVVFCLGLHWSPLPCPSVCGGAVRGRVKRRVGGDGRKGWLKKRTKWAWRTTSTPKLSACLRRARPDKHHSSQPKKISCDKCTHRLCSDAIVFTFIRLKNINDTKTVNGNNK